MTVTNTTAATIRPANAEKWTTALARAKEEGLRFFTINGNPSEWFVTSGVVNGSGYVVKVTEFGMRPWATCQCRGAEFNEACKHKAIIFNQLGILPTR